MLEELQRVERETQQQKQKQREEVEKLEREQEETLRAHAAEKEDLLEKQHQEKRALLEEYQMKFSELQQALTLQQKSNTELERMLAEQKQKAAHDAALATESWNNLVLEKEKENQQIKFFSLEVQQELATLKERKTDLELENTSLKLEAVQLKNDLKHAREQNEDISQRHTEARIQHKQEIEEKTATWNQKMEEVQMKLIRSERSNEDKERSLEVERLRTQELSSQLQLLRTSSQNKLRAIEVTRQLEQQALLTDFQAQLSRVRGEINQIKNQTPKDKQRDWNRAKRDRILANATAASVVPSGYASTPATSGERSRSHSRERIGSPRSAGKQPFTPNLPSSSPLSPAASSIAPATTSARKHIRVRSIGSTPQSPAAAAFGNSLAGSQVFGAQE